MVRLLPPNSVYVAAASRPWLFRNTSCSLRFLLSLFLVAWIAQPDRVTRIIRATFEQQDNVIPFCRKPGYPFLMAASAQRVTFE